MARMAKSEVVEALYYMDARHGSPLNGHDSQLRTTHQRMSLRILGAWCKSPNNCIISYIVDVLQGTRKRENQKNSAHEEIVVVGGAAPHGRPQVTEEGNAGRAGEHVE